MEKYHEEEKPKERFDEFFTSKTNQEDIFLQFGETTGGNYILDFKSPFSFLEAFALAITCLKRKYFCE
ncbi:MAG: tubby family protein [archaeon]|nr:tubby family protein [archaeon]